MRMDANHKVSLGCGTMILIGLIVLIFVSIATNDLRDGFGKLDAKFQILDQRCANFELLLSMQKGEIKREINELRESIDALRQELREANESSGTD